MKKFNLSAGDFPDIASFSSKLNDTKFAEFNTLSQKQIDDLESVLQSEIPKLMELLPSEKDSPETLKAKMAGNENTANVPIPTAANKFGKKEDNAESNPFGFSATDETHYW